MPPARALFYVATAGALTLAAWSLAYEPPPTWVALTCLFLYLCLCVAGVIFARLSMFADVVTLGPRRARGVALTFDDGPDPRSTPKVLDLLDGADAKATFFVIGKKAEEHPELVREISERGHVVAVHSYAHARLFSLFPPWRVKADLERSIEVIHNITGARPRLFRAPIGHVSPSMARVARQLELCIVGWSVRGLDGWAGAKAEHVARKVITKLDDGAIVLLHDASERGDFVPASLEALPKILAAARDKQLPFVRLDRWLGQGDRAAIEEAHDLA
jgi:peptidoglycan/xylan/chitin deacetylase (PgdA/CDA1 family)